MAIETPQEFLDRKQTANEKPYMKEYDLIQTEAINDNTDDIEINKNEILTNKNNMTNLESSVDNISKVSKNSLALINGFSNYTTNRHANVQKMGNLVKLGGLIKNGTLGQPCAVLPVGMRPKEIMEFSCSANIGASRDSMSVRIEPNGNVTPANTSYTYVYLDSVIFFVNEGE